jgi:membrane protein
MPPRQLLRQVTTDLAEDDVASMGAAIAYYALFAIPPMIIFTITLAAAVNQLTGVPVADRLQEIIDERAPGDLEPLLTSLVENAVSSVSGGLASLGVLISALVALWSGSNGVAALIRAFNRAYDVVETRSFFRQKLVSIGLTALMAVLINAAFVLFVFGGQIGSWLADRANLGTAFEIAWQAARFPLSLVFIMVVLAILYIYGPNVRQRFRWFSAGAVLATLLWVLVLLGFRIYLSFVDPGSAYGAMGSLVVFLFFLYLTGITFVLGAEVNAILAHALGGAITETEDQEDGQARAAADEAGAPAR